MGNLPERERIVLQRNSLENDCLEKIASDIGVSTSYCGVLKTQAIKRLRKDSDLIKAVTNYSSYADYHYSVTRFKNTRMSAVEFTAIRNAETLERYQKIYEEIHNRRRAV